MSKRITVKELLESVYLPEMANESRSAVIEKAHNYGKQITRHLIKVYKYHDPQNHDKHVRDMQSWVNKISNSRFNKHSKLEADEYSHHTFESHLDDKTFNAVHKEYSKLPVKATDDAVRHSIMHDVAKPMSKEFSEDKTPIIGHYVKKNED